MQYKIIFNVQVNDPGENAVDDSKWRSVCQGVFVDEVNDFVHYNVAEGEDRIQGKFSIAQLGIENAVKSAKQAVIHAILSSTRYITMKISKRRKQNPEFYLVRVPK